MTVQWFQAQHHSWSPGLKNWNKKITGTKTNMCVHTYTRKIKWKHHLKLGNPYRAQVCLTPNTLAYKCGRTVLSWSMIYFLDLSTAQLLMHKHKHATRTWHIPRATIPLWNHLTTMAVVNEQNESKATKLVKGHHLLCVVLHEAATFTMT